MTIESQRVVPASMQGLTQAIAFVEAFCLQHGIGSRDTLRLTLIVEELFTNTVVHGFGGDSDSTVRIELDAAPRQVALGYQDAAPPFDPCTQLAQAAPALEASIDDRPVGGLGIPLVMQMASRVTYVHEDGFNRLHLILTREP